MDPKAVTATRGPSQRGARSKGAVDRVRLVPLVLGPLERFSLVQGTARKSMARWGSLVPLVLGQLMSA